MSAEVVWHPSSQPKVYVVGGTGGWLVVPALGDRADTRHSARSRTFESLAEAQRYAAALGAELDRPVHLRPHRVTGAGEVA